MWYTSNWHGESTPRHGGVPNNFIERIFIMKKRYTLLLAAGCALLLSGCGGKSDVKDYSKYVELGAYTGLSADRYVTEVTDADVQDYIESDLMPGAEYNEITDRGAQDGDVVVIDYTGTIDGKEFDGGSATDIEMELGTGSYLDEFEDAIVGMKAGEEKTFDLTFPEGYDGVVDGQTATFQVSVKSVIEVVLPEYNDEYVASISDYSTTAEYEANIRETLAQEYEEEATSNACEDLLYTVISESTFQEAPKELLEACRTAMAAEEADIKEMFGADDITDLYGEDYDPDAYLEEMANERMVVYTIAAKEGLELTDEEYQASLEENMELDGYLTAEDYEASIDDKDSYKYELLRQKVLNFLADNNTFQDVSEDEYYDMDEDGDWGDEEIDMELQGVAALAEAPEEDFAEGDVLEGDDLGDDMEDGDAVFIGDSPEDVGSEAGAEDAESAE